MPIHHQINNAQKVAGGNRRKLPSLKSGLLLAGATAISLLKKMGLSIHTLAHDSTPFANHEAAGVNWHTIPDSVCALLATRIGHAQEGFPQLSRIRHGQLVEYVGRRDLEALIQETERIPGSEADFRLAMGKLHAAAATAFAADLKVVCQTSEILSAE